MDPVGEDRPSPNTAAEVCNLDLDLKNRTLMYGMENSSPVLFKQFPQPLAESSDNSASHSSGNGYKGTPVN